MTNAALRWLPAALSALTLAVVVEVAGAQTPKGDLWETTSQMSMEGMPMSLPANKVKVCSAKEWKEPPGGQRSCKNSNMKIDGKKITWDLECTGPTMKGKGEIVRETAESYSGSIKFIADQGNMTVKLTGRKIGECDNPQ